MLYSVVKFALKVAVGKRPTLGSLLAGLHFAASEVALAASMDLGSEVRADTNSAALSEQELEDPAAPAKAMTVAEMTGPEYRPPPASTTWTGAFLKFR